MIQVSFKWFGKNGMILDDSEDLPSCNLLQFAIENGHGWWIYPLKHGDVPQVFVYLPEDRSEISPKPNSWGAILGSRLHRSINSSPAIVEQSSIYHVRKTLQHFSWRSFHTCKLYIIYIYIYSSKYICIYIYMCLLSIYIYI